MASKIYKVKKTRKGKEEIIERDLDGLKKYFGYTLECGRSWNKKINDDPKTIKSFIKNLQMSYEEVEASCFTRTHVELVTD